MDIADAAQTDIDSFIHQAIWLNSNLTRLKANGICHYCLEDTAQIFCCIECRDDYDRELQIKRITGKR